ncbi:MAG: DUF4238 domain-containing protein [Bacilli bacterium]|nr:DUF4238 domain-containing protein [Bacilli bacterium]
MKNSHYVPRFILKKFSDKLCLYNVKTGELKENVKPEKAYMEKGFYSDEIEDKLNLKLEMQFAKLLSDKILKCENTVELSRDELKLVKKFLLISVIRSIGNEQFMQVEKRFYDNLIELFMKKGLTKEEAVKASEKPFEEVKIPNETPFDYWMRTIDVILETDGSPEDILKHPNKTYPAFRWAGVINAGYLAFWDSEYKRDEFVITDIGMTSENEKGWNGVSVHNTKKTKFLIDLFEIEKHELMRQEIYKQINFVKSFHENFQMFPISAKRMIVEIAPFYKFRYAYRNVYSMPRLKDLTALINEDLYSPNENQYVYPQTSIIPKFHKDDRYIYKIKKLSREETRYCNALFLDRINTTLGFSSLNKAIGSILYYKKLNSYPYVPRVDYKSLYAIINSRYEGSLM